MTWVQLLAQAAVFATFLGFFVALAAYFNGKNMRRMIGRMEEGLRKTIMEMGEGLIRTIKEMDERHVAILEGIEKTLAKMEENAVRRHEDLVSLIIGKGRD